MAQAPRMTRRDVGGPQRISTVVGSGGDYHRALGRSMAGVTAKLSQNLQVKEKKAEQIAIDKSGKQGKTDGLTGQGAPKLRAGQSPADMAYNAAVQRSYLRRIETQARGDFDGLAAAHAGDPAQMQEKLTNYAAGLRQGLPPELSAEMDLMLEGLARPYISAARRDHEKAVLAADRGAMLEQLQERSLALSRNAYLGEMSPENDALIAGEIDGMRNLLVSHGPKTKFALGGVTYDADPSRSGAMDPEAIAKFMGSVETDAHIAKIKGVFSRLDGEAAQSEFAQSFMADFEKGEGLAGQLAPDDFEDLRADMARTLKTHVTARKSAATATRQKMRDIQSVIANGLDPGAASLAAVRVQAAASGDPEVQADYEALKRSRNFMMGLQSQTPAEIRAYVTQMRGGGGSFDRAASDRLKMAEGYLNKAEAEIKKDPINFVAKRGLMEMRPLDASSETFADDIAARMVQAETIADEYDLEKPVYFSEDERKDFARMAAQGGEAMLGLAQNITAGDPSRAMAMLGEISDDAPALANAAAISLSGGDPSVVADMAAGIELRQMDGFKSRLPKRSTVAQVEKSAAQALSLLPKHMIAARETAQAIYEGKAQSGGVFPDAGENEKIEDGADYQLYAQSLNRALGAQFIGGVQYGGLAPVGRSALLAPVWAKAERFEDLMDSLDAEDFAATGEMPVDAQGRTLRDKDLRNLHYQAIGAGRYRVSFNDPFGPDPQYLADPRTGDAYVLDLHRLRVRFNFDKRRRYIVGGR